MPLNEPDRQNQQKSAPVPIKTVPLKSPEASPTDKQATPAKHNLRSFGLFKKKTIATASRVKRGYHKADSAVLWSARKALPRSAQERLAANRALHNGNLRFYVPVAFNNPRKIPVTVPNRLRHARHATLPVIVIAVLIFVMLPVKAAPVYSGTKTIGGSGADAAKKIAIDSQGNRYTVGSFEGTVNFSEDWEAPPEDILQLADNFDDGTLDAWEYASGDLSASTDRSVSGSYSLRATQGDGSESTSLQQSITPSSGLSVESKIYFDGNADMTNFLTLYKADFPGEFYNFMRFTSDPYDPESDMHDMLCLVEYGACADNVLPANTWITVRTEIKLDQEMGFIKVYVDNELAIDITEGVGDGYFATVMLNNESTLLEDWALATGSSVYFDDVSITSTEGQHDKLNGPASFITKTNADGSYGWTKYALAYSGIGSINAIAIDSNDNIYVGGSFEDELILPRWDGCCVDRIEGAGGTDGFVAKINADGSYSWVSWQVGGEGDDAVTSLAIDANDNVYIGGTFSDQVNLAAGVDGGTDMHTALETGTDGFVAQVDSTGDYIWGRSFGGTANDTVSAVVVDSENDYVYAAGDFSDNVDFAAHWSGDDVREDAGGQDAFLTKLGTAGGYEWTKTIGSSGNDYVKSVSLNSVGDVFLAGSFDSDTTLNFAQDWSGTDTKNGSSDADGYVTKVNANGSYGWTHVISGNGGAETVNDIAVDSEDNIFVGGSFETDNLNFGADWSDSDTKSNAGADDGFVTRLQADGSYGWTVPLGSNGSDYVSGLAIDDEDAAYAVGGFTGTVDFAEGFGGSDEKASMGNIDAFIMRLVNEEGALHTITDAGGLTYEDENGTNLSSTGSSEQDLTVYVRDQDDDTLLATVGANLSQNRNWSGASGDSDLSEHKMFLSGIIGAPGAASNLTLYVPRDATDRAVVLCPGADALEAVTANCPNKITYTDNDVGVDTVSADDVDYWTVTGVSNLSIGAMSIAFPGVSISETDEGTTVTEGGAGDYISVQLNAQPTDDVVVTLTPSTGGRLETLDPLTFTSGDWDDPQLVLLEAINNNTISGNDSFTLSYEATSSDANYDETSAANVVTVNWIDDDEAGVAWYNTDNLTSESGDTAAVCVVLTAEPTDDVTIGVESADTDEITLSGGSIVIEPENWDATGNCVTATGQNDDLTDGSQEVEISITSIDSEDTYFDELDPGDIEPLVLTNQDNDNASFTVSTSDPAETTEAGGTAEICVVLSARPVSGNVTIPLSVSDPSEASLASNSLVIAAADWDAEDNCVTITGENDNLTDGDIEYDIITGDPTATDPVWDALGAGNIANPTYTNLDDDVAGLTIAETSGSTTVTEGGATDEISVRLNTQPAPENEVVVHVQPNGQLDIGEGAGQADTLTFDETNWDTPQTVTVSAVNDTSVEGTHSGTVTFTIHESTTEAAYDGLSPEQINVSITDNDVAIASISTSNDAIENPADNGVFRVALNSTNNTGGNITINYSVSGTAVAGTHYDALTGNVNIANGQNGADIVVDISEHDNGLLEGNKTVIVTLTGSASADAEISENDDTATVIIFDDDTATASLSTSQDGDEDGSVSIEYTVSLSKTNNTGAPIAFDIDPSGGTATASNDYTNFAGATIEVLDGATTGLFAVTVIDDELFEPVSETVIATITDPSLAAVSITPENDTSSATITDDDTTEINITATDPTAVENPHSIGEFTISLDKTNNTGSGVIVTYEVTGTATPGSDYDALSGEATIANGQSTATITVDTEDHDDDLQEGSETVIVTLISTNLGGRIALGEDSSDTVTITDDESAGVIVTSDDDTTSETGESGEVCFTLTSQPSASVTMALSSSDESKVTVDESIEIEPEDWDAEDNCVTATGLNDDPPVATGTLEVTIITGDVTSLDSFYDELVGEDVEDMAIYHADDDTASIEMDVVDNTTGESGDNDALIQFRLTSRPSASVTIPISVSDPTEGTLDGITQLVIEPEDWDDYAANQVIIQGVDDYFTDGDIEYTFVTGNPASSDELYDDLGAGDIDDPTLTNIDDDEASVTITATGGTTNVTEGGATDTQTVEIGSRPASGNQVVITATPSNAQINLGAGAGQAVNITFTNSDWADPKTVTITAVDDSLLESTHTSSVVYAIDTASTSEQTYKDYVTALPTLSVTISDNDTATADLSASDGNEANATSASFTVTLSKPNNTGSAITFTLDPSGGSATGDVDYEGFSNTVLSVANGQTTAFHEVEVVDDSLLESDETIQATLSNASLGIVTIDEASAEATITDNDTAEVTITANDDSAAENPSDNGEFTITLSKTNYTGSDITVDYSVTGTATADTDYAELSGSATIAHNSYSTTIAVDTLGYDDKLTEGDETVIITLDETDHARVSVDDPDEASVTIADDDEPSVTVSESDDTTEVTEGGASDTQTVAIGTQPAPGNAVVIVATPENAQLDLGAGAGNAIELTFTNEDWEDPQVITIHADDDSLLESDHESSIAYSINPDDTTESAYDTYGSLPELSVFITDNDTATADLSADNGNEADSDPASFTITLSKVNNTGSAITFTLNPSGGSATTEDDYADFASTTLSVANGESTASHEVEVVDDDLLEADETIQATGSNSSLGIVTIDEATATATIVDDDTATATITAGDPSAAENPSDNGQFTISLSKTNYTGGDITVDYSVGGTASANTDYLAVSGNIVVPNNELSAIITINTTGLDDKLIEGDETVIITLQDINHSRVSVGDPDTATVTISDDDEPNVIILATDSTTEVVEGGATDTHTVEIGTQPAPGNEVVIVASPENAQLDLGAGAGNAVELTFTNDDWEEAQTVTITAVDDSLLESDHISSIAYSINTDDTTESAYDAFEPMPELSVSIADNDTATASLSAEDGSETDSNHLRFTVTLTKQNNTGSPITFALDPDGGTATLIDDYENFAGTTLSVQDGDDSAHANVAIVDDNVLENDETVAGELSESSLDIVSIDQATATATISDNDTAEVSITATVPAAENPSSNGEFMISLSKTNYTGSDITIQYTTTGSASAGDDYETLSGSAVISNEANNIAIQVETDGFDDKLIEGDETVVVTLDGTSHSRVSVGDPDHAAVTITDDDEPTLNVTASDTSTEVTEGGATDIQTIVIGTQPASGNEVVITATPTNSQINLGAGAGNAVERTFTNANWETPQTVTVTAVDDSLLEADHTSGVVYTINNDSTTENPYDDYELPTLEVNITDNDTATADLSAADGSEEDTEDASFTVTLSKTNNTGVPITFTLSPSGGSAIADDDYADFEGVTLSVADGSTIATRQVGIVDDALLEGTETIEGTIANASLGAVTINIASDTANITDNDTTEVTVTATDETANENPSSNGEFTISLGKTNYSSGSIAVNYTVSGTAVADEDYSALSGTASVASGEYETTILVDTTGKNDDSVEGNKTVIITLDETDHPLVAIGDPDTATVTIIDDDTPSVIITASGGSTNVAEGGATDTHSIQIGTQPAPDTQVVIIATPIDSQLDLGAGAGNPVERSFDDSSWSNPQTVTVAAVDDALLEMAHSSSVTYSINLDTTSDPDYLNYEDTLPTLSVNITDNDTATASLGATDGSETGPADMVFTVTLSKTNHTGAPITFTLNPSGGSATTTSDYANFASTTISVANGAISGTANVAVVDDSLLEGDETVAGTISSSSLGAVTISNASDTATIADNDTTEATIVATDPTATENPSTNGEFTIYLNRVNNTGSPITVNYTVSGSATADSDYAALSGSAVIAAGNSTTTIIIDTTSLNDDSVEGNETVIVTLDGTDHPLVDIGVPDSASVTIADDDSFTMNIETTQNGDEEGSLQIIYTVSLNHINDTGQDITATLSDTNDGTADSEDDYEAFGDTILIPDGEQSVEYTVTVIDDDNLEGTESVGAVISNPSDGDLGITTATATITDNDTAVVTVSAIDPTAAENPSDNGTFQVELDKTNYRSSAIQFTYSVNGTATGGQDYATLSGHAMIASGQTSTTITVDTNGYDDSVFEGNETVIITLTGSSLGVVSIGSPHQATVTITDDDPEPTEPNPPASPSSQPPKTTVRTVYVPANPQAIADTPTPIPLPSAPQPVDQTKPDLDRDGIIDEEEAKANNNGDGNGDGIPDSKQRNVASLLSSITNRPVTLEAIGDCKRINSFSVIPEAKLEKQDGRYRYPYGLVDYTLSCNKPGQQSTVTIYYDRTYSDIAQWRKSHNNHQGFAALASAHLSSPSIGSQEVSAISYDISDGGELDDDGMANRQIIDPAGPAVRTFYFMDGVWLLTGVVGLFSIIATTRYVYHKRKV